MAAGSRSSGLALMRSASSVSWEPSLNPLDHLAPRANCGQHATHDGIVVGAGCAGAPTAMLLAHRGYRVLLVDPAEFPSDTLSSHIIGHEGLVRLRRWGLL